MLWAAVSYSLGIVAGAYLWRPLLWWAFAGAAFAAAAAYFAQRRSWLGWSLGLGALFFAGALHIQARVPSDATLDMRIQSYAEQPDLRITGHVTRDGRLQQGGLDEIRQTIDLETDEIQKTTGAV